MTQLKKDWPALLLFCSPLLILWACKIWFPEECYILMTNMEVLIEYYR